MSESVEPRPLHAAVILPEGYGLVAGGNVNEELIVVSVVSDMELAYGDNIRRIRPDAFALNALLRADTWATNAELKDSIGFPHTQPRFTERINRLDNVLRELTSLDTPIERSVAHAQSRRLRLSPRLLFQDVREDASGDLYQFGTGRVTEEGRVVFDGLEERRRVLGSMFALYAGDTGVAVRVQRRYQENSRKRQEEVELPAEAVYAHFSAVEHALSSFIVQKGRTNAQDADIRQGLASYYELYISTAPLIQNIVGRASSRPSGYHLGEEMLQNARLEVLQTILSFGHRVADLKTKSSYFYQLCVRSVLGAVSETVLKSVTSDRSITFREYYLRTDISEAFWRLTQSGIAVPTPEQIKDDINKPDISTDDIAACMQRMETATAALSHEESWQIFNLPGSRYFSEQQLDRELDNIIFSDTLDRLFRDDGLSPKERIMLSLYYGVWSPTLRGQTIHNARQGTTFRYPHDQESFYELISIGEIESFRRVGEIVSYSGRGVNNIITHALGEARKIIDNPL